MRHKKAQFLTAFIILGILILAVFLYFLAMRKESINIPASSTTGASAVQIYVENCLGAVSNFAVYKIGKQGGYMETPADSYRDKFLDVAYAFDSYNTFVALPKMQSDIQDFINNNLKNCTAGFLEFKSKGLDIQEGDVASAVHINAKSIMVVAEYPLQVRSGDTKFSIEKFSADVPVAIGTIHSEIDSFVSDFDDRYDLTYLNGINSNVYVMPLGDTDLFLQESLNSSIRGENYLFLYSVR